MKGPSDRTKVVLRHLPPAISQATLMAQIDGSFSGRYDWVSFHPGKTSPRNQTFSRAYIDFKRPEDVLEFAEFFNGHIFVNEKGTQFKTIVEYAPSQRVPNHWFSKDGREGTIFKDPEYLEFLEFLSKPVENLPSAEVQLERREAERAGTVKDSPIVTPLMDFVRQKRASKAGYGKPVANGKLSRRAGGASGRSPSSSSKRGAGKKKISTMYVLRDSIRNKSGKDNETFILFAKRDDQQLFDRTVIADGADTLVEDIVTGGGRKKVLLLKGKEREISRERVTTSVKSAHGSAVSRSNSQHEGGGKMIRNMLLNKDVRQSQLSRDKIEQPMLASNLEDKRPPRLLKETNGSAEDRGIVNESHGYLGGKLERRTRNKGRSDCGNQRDKSNSRNGDAKTLGSGCSSNYHSENSCYKILGHRGTVQSIRDSESPSFAYEGKYGKRGATSGYGAQEKQVWVQKSSSGS